MMMIPWLTQDFGRRYSLDDRLHVDRIQFNYALGIYAFPRQNQLIVKAPFLESNSFIKS